MPTRLRRAAGWAGVVLVALSAAAAGVVTLGGVDAAVGPLTARLHLSLSPHGGTQVDLAPFGRVTLDTHTGPLRLEGGVESVSPRAVSALVQQGLSSPGVRAQITGDLRDGVEHLLLRSAVVAVLAAALACALVHRRWRAVVVGALAAATALAASCAVAATTFRSEAAAEPTFDGLLAQAPAVLGGVAARGDALDAQARRVSQLTSNIAQLYGALGATADEPSDDAVRLLWVSDVHNNPAAYDVMATLVERFDVAAVVDTGDSTDLGSAAENGLHAAAGRFDVPYLWVRGNHDSATTQEYLAGLPGVVVLDDGAVADVAGLRVTGTGDPRYTPFRQVQGQEGAEEELRAAGSRLAAAVSRSDDPVDVALVHEPGMAGPLLGVVPLVLDGHVHERRSRAVDGTIELTQGSSGGAGLRTLDSGTALPLEMSVLHLDAADGDLLAVDDITIGGVGERSISLERRTAASYLAEEEPAEPPAPAGPGGERGGGSDGGGDGASDGPDGPAPSTSG